MELSLAQKETLLRDGFVVLPSVVPQTYVDHALRAINHALGDRNNGGRKVNGDDALHAQPAITDLFNRTPAYAILESLVGENAFEPATNGQIALNFPSLEQDQTVFSGHMDGMLRAHEGKVESFTALVGVILSDQTADGAGNFAAWPGSHLQHEQYFKQHGPEVLITEEKFMTEYQSSGIDYGEAVQVKGKPGDLIIAHYMLLHSAAYNQSPNIRYSCYFRIDHQERKLDWKAPLTDAWLHFPGMRG